jgi:hypothetical protein
MILYSIVEGHGEVVALPILLRRVSERLGRFDVEILRPHRIARGRILHGTDLERAAEIGRRRIREYEGKGAIMLMMDADEDCAANLAQSLRDRLKQVVGEMPVRVVLAVREYEAWLIAAARSLRASGRVVATAEPPHNPEGLRGAKEYLARRLLARGVYSETVDQPALTALMSLDEARACRSFEKLYRDVVGLLAVEA